jgi:hypothetical protein
MLMLKRRYLWEELVGIMSWWELLWCIGGVFYVKNQARQSVVILEFSKFIFDQGLMDIPLVGENFTWSNNRDL